MEKRVTFHERWLPYLLVAPQIVITLVFFFWPSGQAIWQSVLTEDAFGGNSKFVWFDNFASLFHDSGYYASVRLTLLFSALVASVGFVPMAIATDFNPGSSPVNNLWTAATLACLTMGLTVEEALAGITRNAARALGRPDLGWLGAGSAADIALFPAPVGEPPSVEVLVQHLGGTRAEQVWKAGERVL